jgi:hypothetical protein
MCLVNTRIFIATIDRNLDRVRIGQIFNDEHATDLLYFPIHLNK